MPKVMRVTAEDIDMVLRAARESYEDAHNKGTHTAWVDDCMLRELCAAVTQGLDDLDDAKKAIRVAIRAIETHVDEDEAVQQARDVLAKI